MESREQTKDLDKLVLAQYERELAGGDETETQKEIRDEAYDRLKLIEDIKNIKRLCVTLTLENDKLFQILSETFHHKPSFSSTSQITTSLKRASENETFAALNLDSELDKNKLLSLHDALYSECTSLLELNNKLETDYLDIQRRKNNCATPAANTTVLLPQSSPVLASSQAPLSPRKVNLIDKVLKLKLKSKKLKEEVKELKEALETRSTLSFQMFHYERSLANSYSEQIKALEQNISTLEQTIRELQLDNLEYLEQIKILEKNISTSEQTIRELQLENLEHLEQIKFLEQKILRLQLDSIEQAKELKKLYLTIEELNERNIEFTVFNKQLKEHNLKLNEEKGTLQQTLNAQQQTEEFKKVPIRVQRNYLCLNYSNQAKNTNDLPAPARPGSPSASHS